MSQSQIMASLDEKDRRKLLQEATYKIDEKISKDDLFGINSLGINLWLMLKTLHSEDSAILKEFNQKDIQTAMETGLLVKIDVNILYKISKEYTYENK